MGMIIIAGVCCFLVYASGKQANVTVLKKMVALIDQKKCISCGLCAKGCPNEAISEIEKDKKIILVIDPGKCNACGICVQDCPKKAVILAKPSSDKPYGTDIMIDTKKNDNRSN
jgi:ferredoxin